MISKLLLYYCKSCVRIERHGKKEGGGRVRRGLQVSERNLTVEVRIGHSNLYVFVQTKYHLKIEQCPPLIE